MSKKNKKGGSGLGDAVRSIFTTGAIIAAFVIAVLIYLFIMGNPINFEGGNPDGHPLPGNYLGIVYKGGWVVPVLIAINIVVLIFSIERWITLSRAKGRGRIAVFVKKLRDFLDAVGMQEIIEGDQELSGILVTYDDDPNQVLKIDGQGQMRFLCDRIIKRWHARFMKT